MLDKLPAQEDDEIGLLLLRQFFGAEGFDVPVEGADEQRAMQECMVLGKSNIRRELIQPLGTAGGVIIVKRVEAPLEFTDHEGFTESDRPNGLDRLVTDDEVRDSALHPDGA